MLPRINAILNFLTDNIKIVWDEKKKEEEEEDDDLQPKTNNTIMINKTLFCYLKNVKTKIDKCQHEWDKYKKYTNPHEYIHSIIPNTKQSVCSLKPLSRSFYKMIEISTLLNIHNELPKNSCQTFHLAEGPGGFIEAVVKMRNNANDRYYGMTLINDQDHNVPGWHKSKHFLDQNKNVLIEYGKDGTGDLQNAENLLYCYEKYANSMDLITADGGFDFSYDFNNQETECTKLIFCQICFAIAMQKIGGTFVIKFFDSFTRVSLEMLYLLSALYEEVYFIKPNTSRHANSEKYVVCKKYRANADLQGFIMKLYMIIQAMQEQAQAMQAQAQAMQEQAQAMQEQAQAMQEQQQQHQQPQLEKNIISLFAVEIPYLYSNRIEEYNAIFGQQQIENIHMTLQLILNNKRDKLETMKKTHIQKCIEWCQKYNIPYHKNILNNNIFLSSLSSKQQQPILIL